MKKTENVGSVSIRANWGSGEVFPLPYQSQYIFFHISYVDS